MTSVTHFSYLQHTEALSFLMHGETGHKAELVMEMCGHTDVTIISSRPSPA